MLFLSFIFVLLSCLFFSWRYGVTMHFSCVRLGQRVPARGSTVDDRRSRLYTGTLWGLLLFCLYGNGVLDRIVGTF